MELLLNLADKGIKLGDVDYISQIEIFIQHGFKRAIELKNNSVQGSQQQTTSGIGVRAYNGKKLGIASATLLSEKALEETVKSAIKLSKLAPEDDDFHSLPEPTGTPVKIKNLFDENLVGMDPEEMIKTADLMVEGAHNYDDRSISSGRITSNFSEIVIVNSLGIKTSEQLTGYSAFSSVSIPKETNNVGFGYDYFETNVKDEKFDYYELGEKAAIKAKKYLDAKQPPSKNLPILFDHRATHGTIGSIIGVGVNGFSVMNKTSYYADKIGEKISTDKLNVIDNPHVDGGTRSSVYDKEGVPTTRIKLVENGVLTSFVTDSYSAYKLGLENTGSANRFSLSAKPKPGIHQLHISAGENSYNEMLADMKEGLFVETSVRPAAGSPNISSKIDRGFYVLNGEIQYPVKNTMIGSDVYNFMNNITAISKETLSEFGTITPAILVNNLSISGK